MHLTAALLPARAHPSAATAAVRRRSVAPKTQTSGFLSVAVCRAATARPLCRPSSLPLFPLQNCKSQKGREREEGPD